MRSPNQYRVPNKLAQEYLARYDGLTLAESTVETYDAHLTEFVRYLRETDNSVLSADFGDVESYVESCVRRGNRQSTISGKLSTVRELYRHIRLRTDEGDNLALDPLRLQEIDLDEYNTPAEIEREALSRSEIRRLFDAFESYRNRLMAIVGIETGLRNSDIRNLLLEDLGTDLIHVRDPKGAKPYDVPISAELRFELDHWLANHRGGYASAEESQYVFPSHHAEKLETNGSLNSIIKDAAQRAGIQDTIGTISSSTSSFGDVQQGSDERNLYRVTAHTLRHSFITLLAEAGVDLQYRQLAANHQNAETTLGYDHSDRDVFQSLRDQYTPPR